MIFHVRCNFLIISFCIQLRSLAMRVALGDKWREIHLTWTTIQKHFLTFLRKGALIMPNIGPVIKVR